MRSHLLRAGKFAGGAPPAGPLLLDDYPGALMALSLRALSSSTTNVVRVMRTSDNAESDFTATEVADGTMLAWCGASDGRVVTMYDQGVNGNHATGLTAKPLVVVAGVQVMEAGLPSMLFASAQNQGLTTTANPAGRADIYAATTLDRIAGSILVYGGGSAYGWVSQSGSTSTIIHSAFGAPSLYVNGAVETPVNRGDVYNLLSGRKLQTTINANFFWSVRLGGYGATFAYEGNMQEFIVYDSDTSADRADIEANINSHYAIF